MWRITGTACSTPSIAFSFSTYWVLRLAVEIVNCIEPGRVKMISALRFDERRCRSLDMPVARPVKSITRQTPKAMPAMLTIVRTGRWRMFEVIRLSIFLSLSEGLHGCYSGAAKRSNYQHVRKGHSAMNEDYAAIITG